MEQQLKQKKILMIGIIILPVLYSFQFNIGITVK